jgi:hypothetical protein
MPQSYIRASFSLSECKFISLQKYPKKSFALPLFAMFYEQFGAYTRCSCLRFISHYILRLVVKQLFLLYTFVPFFPVYAPLRLRSPGSAMAANMIGVPKAIIVVSLGIMDLVMFNPAITQ